jgi:hypothetical protein
MKRISDADIVNGTWSITNSNTIYSLGLDLIWINKYISLDNVKYYLTSLEQNKAQLSVLPAGYYAEINANQIIISCKITLIN